MLEAENEVNLREFLDKELTIIYKGLDSMFELDDCPKNYEDHLINIIQANSFYPCVLLQQLKTELIKKYGNKYCEKRLKAVDPKFSNYKSLKESKFKGMIENKMQEVVLEFNPDIHQRRTLSLKESSLSNMAVKDAMGVNPVNVKEKLSVDNLRNPTITPNLEERAKKEIKNKECTKKAFSQNNQPNLSVKKSVEDNKSLTVSQVPQSEAKKEDITVSKNLTVSQIPQEGITVSKYLTVSISETNKKIEQTDVLQNSEMTKSIDCRVEKSEYVDRSSAPVFISKAPQADFTTSVKKAN